MSFCFIFAPVYASLCIFLNCSIAGKYGITGVPSLLLFYDGRPVAKFNKSRTLQGLEEFITNSTGILVPFLMKLNSAE